MGQHQLRTASGKKKGWENWAEEDWSQGGGGLFLWTKEEREAPIAAATEEGGRVTLHPGKVAKAFAQAWSKLWKPATVQEDKPWDRKGPTRQEEGLEPITGDRVKAALRGVKGKRRQDRTDGLLGTSRNSHKKASRTSPTSSTRWKSSKSGQRRSQGHSLSCCPRERKGSLWDNGR